MSFTLEVNGTARTVDAPADMPLLWVLRDLLGLRGTKFGCGAGLCGACTVHVDGLPTRSCITPAASLADAKINTIEGLSATGSHPLQQAWRELNVPQCGYCQAGQIMSAAALLRNNPRPTDQEIDTAMDGNLCRCATYLRIRKAIHRAAELHRAAASHLAAAIPGGSATHSAAAIHNAAALNASPDSQPNTTAAVSPVANR